MLLTTGGTLGDSDVVDELETISSNNSVALTNGSEWSTGTGPLFLGLKGSGNSVSVGKGSILATSGLTLGSGDEDDATAGGTNTLTVSGIATEESDGQLLIRKAELANNGDLLIGTFGSGNAVTISDGAVASNSGTICLGEEDGSSSNSLSISGVKTIGDTPYATTVTNDGSGIYIGLYGSDNTLEVSTGAKLTSTSASLLIGLADTASDNKLVLLGRRGISVSMDR